MYTLYTLLALIFLPYAAVRDRRNPIRVA